MLLTEDTAQINSSSTYMGKLSTLLEWHQADPVEAAEQLRNDLIHSLYQTNRNPFVDHPEWINLTFAPSQTNPLVLNIRSENGEDNVHDAMSRLTNLSHAGPVTVNPQAKKHRAKAWDQNAGV